MIGIHLSQCAGAILPRPKVLKLKLPFLTILTLLATSLLISYIYFSGVGYRPKPSMDSVESTLVQFRHGELGNWKPWVERLDDFLKGRNKTS